MKGGQVSREEFKTYYFNLRKVIKQSKKMEHLRFLSNSRSLGMAMWTLNNCLRGPRMKQKESIPKTMECSDIPAVRLYDTNKFYINLCPDLATNVRSLKMWLLMKGALYSLGPVQRR
ncbi:hypothetical protein HHI36_016762 [Cryptolaemus montrouzieri]|uniref:Uncharacterized protein n=1 Tax=Cryptolaemus montrouzieri TaxID=559131 RepID=A0ABD2NKX6_9CUCU